MANPEHLAKLKEGVEAWNEWRDRNPEIRPDLSGANLLLANLRAANLRNANLRNANLSYADLGSANLTRADLTGADLRKARLSGANLRAARLYEVNFFDAELRRTNFAHCSLIDTAFAHCNLALVEGLTAAVHVGPSSVSTSTLEETAQGLSEDASRKGEVEAFLRGCGVRDDWLHQYQGFIGSPISFFSCFISYSHPDKAFARRLYDTLQGRGIRCWLDEHQILPGDNIRDRIDEGIRIWDKVLLVCSEASLKSWWVDKEIEMGLRKEEQLWKQREERVMSIIPLALDRYFMDQWSGGKAPQVQDRLAADFTGWEQDNAKFEEQFEWVVKALQTKEGREKPPEPRL